MAMANWQKKPTRVCEIAHKIAMARDGMRVIARLAIKKEAS